MRSMLLVAMISSMLASVAGCGFQTQAAQESKPATPAEKKTNSGVAILDLDAVAKRLGRDTEMDKTLKARETSLNEGLSDRQNFYNREFEQAKQQLGPQPTEQQTLQLQKKQQSLIASLAHAKQEAQRDLLQFKAKLVNRFREEVIPVARKAAAEVGRDVVVTKNTNVIFSFAPQADITDRVVELLLANPPALKPIAPPSRTSQNRPPPATRPAPQTQPRQPVQPVGLRPDPRQGDPRQSSRASYPRR